MTSHTKLERVFQNVFNNDRLLLEDSLDPQSIEDWDSVNFVNLLFAIEMEFGIQLGEDDYDHFENIGKLKKRLGI